jgi:hypothetical protein
VTQAQWVRGAASALLVVSAACSAEPRSDTPSPAGDLRAPVPSADSPTVATASDDGGHGDISPPRRPLSIDLRPLWSSTPSDIDSVFVLPNDLRFSSSGLLVFDAADRVVRVFDAANGALKGTIGREGGGPGEFSASMRFLGAFDAPMLFDPRSRRLVALSGEELTPESVPMTAGRSWISMCGLDRGSTLGTVLGRAGAEFLITRSGEVVDSLATPWPELEADDFLIRQAIAQQLDDGSCLLMTLYRGSFAVYEPGAAIRRGVFVEAPPRAAATVTRDTAAKATWHSLPPGTVAGPVHAAAWRDLVVILFRGRGPHRDRVLDLYRSRDLAYVGSVLLPTLTQRIAVRGDTLVLIGEREDLPFVAAYLLSGASARRD